MNLLIHAHALTVTVAVSYLTLLGANPVVAKQAIWLYAVIMCVLAVVNLLTERHHHHGQH